MHAEHLVNFLNSHTLKGPHVYSKLERSLKQNERTQHCSPSLETTARPGMHDVVSRLSASAARPPLCRCRELRPMARHNVVLQQTKRVFVPALDLFAFVHQLRMFIETSPLPAAIAVSDIVGAHPTQLVRWMRGHRVDYVVVDFRLGLVRGMSQSWIVDNRTLRPSVRPVVFRLALTALLLFDHLQSPLLLFSDLRISRKAEGLTRMRFTRHPSLLDFNEAFC